MFINLEVFFYYMVHFWLLIQLWLLACVSVYFNFIQLCVFLEFTYMYVQLQNEVQRLFINTIHSRAVILIKKKQKYYSLFMLRRQRKYEQKTVDVVGWRILHICGKTSHWNVLLLIHYHVLWHHFMRETDQRRVLNVYFFEFMKSFGLVCDTLWLQWQWEQSRRLLAQKASVMNNLILFII